MFGSLLCSLITPPILLGAKDSTIHSFDYSPLREISFEETTPYQIYKKFLNNQNK